MLTLPIKKKWLDMILSGEKKEEYREVKPYYDTRFANLFPFGPSFDDYKEKIMFRNGYSKDSPQFTAICTFDIGMGKQEWGAEAGKNYYILKICEIVEKKNC